MLGAADTLVITVAVTGTGDIDSAAESMGEVQTGVNAQAMLGGVRGCFVGNIEPGMASHGKDNAPYLTIG